MYNNINNKKRSNSTSYYVVVALTWFVIGLIVSACASLMINMVNQNSSVSQCICETLDCDDCFKVQLHDNHPLKNEVEKFDKIDLFQKYRQSAIKVAWDYIEYRYHILSQTLIKTV